MIRTLTAAALAVCLAAGSLAAQTLPATPQACPDTATTPVDASLQAALDLVNAQRKQAGVAPLTLNPLLTKAAQSFADDMAAYNYFSHYGRDGSTPGSRITAAGYKWSSYGENIAKGYASWQDAIRGWMNSPGHRANMLNARFKEIGLGVKNRVYVQDFATSR